MYFLHFTMSIIVNTNSSWLYGCPSDNVSVYHPDSSDFYSFILYHIILYYTGVQKAN